MKNLVEIIEEKHQVILDIRYASKNNICQKELYSRPICFLHFETEKKLKKAVELAKEKKLKIKIFDAYRPIKVQEYMFNMFPGDFVSNPKTGAIPHCRGIAIDLTLCDENNQEIEMGSDFDEFSNLAFHDCEKISKSVQENRKKLLEIMTKAGFDSYSKEWWHYQLFNPRDYEIIASDKKLISNEINL